MSRPIVAHIDTSAFVRNLTWISREQTNSQVWAVMKCDAYGHGLKNLVSRDLPADGIAVLDLAEAVLVRQLGWVKPVLMLEGSFGIDDWIEAAHYQLSMVVHTIEQIEWLKQSFAQKPLIMQTIPGIWLKFNTGMNRLGFVEQLDEIERQLEHLPVKIEGVMTHLACADEREHFSVLEQKNRFDQLVTGSSLPRSMANSAAVLWHRDLHHAWVRPGIILYGASPSGQWQDIERLPLSPVMQLESTLIAIQNVKAGAAVGYGAAWRADRDVRVGIVACGYGDGYPRHAPSGTPIVVDGVRTNTIGRISMDMLAVDITRVPSAQLGSRVQLWGKQLSADEVAKFAGTLAYELFCAVAPRVPRIVE